MSLADADRAILETYLGPLEDDTEAESVHEARIARLGSAYVAALEVLRTDRAAMRRTPTVVRSGDDTSDHSKNLAALDAAIAELLASIDVLVADGSVSLTPAAEVAVSAARGVVTLDPTPGLTVEARSPRSR